METLIAGSYDRFLFGFECSSSSAQEEISYSLKRKFTHAAHKAHVKCLASSLPYIASGGADDLIHLYDLQAGTDMGFLISPGSGAVSALAWHAQEKEAPSHLFSGAADGSISVWQAGADWTCYKTLHSHKKEVNSLAIHPSGRLALSTSRDNTLKLWNMVKGKCVHTTTKHSAADQVAFAPDGNSYAVLLERTVLLHDLDSGEQPRHVLSHSRRMHCLSYFSPAAVLTGSEEGSLQLWDPRTGSEPVFTIAKGHSSRVKGVAPLHGTSEPRSEVPSLVASASSDGMIRVWDMRKAMSSHSGGFTFVAEADTGARLTCLASMNLSSGDVVTPATRAKLRFVKEPETSKGQTAGKQKQKGKAEKKIISEQKASIAKSGIAHNGVVEFPDDVDVKLQAAHKQSRKHAEKDSSSRQTHPKLKVRKTVGKTM